MGISETDILHWNFLHNAFALAAIRAVCDLGQQELHLLDRPAAVRICADFADRLGCAGTDITPCRSSAEMWRKLGRKIVSLDLVGSGDDLVQFDLNSDQIPREMRGQFDLVTNCGTSEHVMNQHNVFKVMHELARSNGVMYHSVPIAGHTNHGLISYNLRMFTAVGRTNNYMPLDFLLSVHPGNRALDSGLLTLLREFPGFRRVRSEGYPWNLDRATREFVSTDANARVIFQKLEDAPFKIPLQLPETIIDPTPTQ